MTRRTLLAIGCLALSGCSGDDPVGLSSATPPDPELAAIASALADAMELRDVRLEILNEMRISPYVAHRLMLSEFLQDSGDLTMEAMGRVFPGGAEGLRALLEELGGFELVMPLAAHRRSWTGGGQIFVGFADGPTDGFIHGVGPSEYSRRVDDLEVLKSFGAFFMIRPSDTRGRRVARVLDPAGRTVESLGDGQIAITLTIEDSEAGSTQTIDFGSFDTPDALNRALRQFGAGVQVNSDWTFAATECEEAVVEDGLQVRYLGCTGGGGSSGATYLDQFRIYFADMFGDPDCEVEFTGSIGSSSGTLRFEGVREEHGWHYPGLVLVGTEISGAGTLNLSVKETDWGPDDDKGSRVFGSVDNGQIRSIYQGGTRTTDVKLSW